MNRPEEFDRRRPLFDRKPSPAANPKTPSPRVPSRAARRTPRFLAKVAAAWLVGALPFAALASDAPAAAVLSASKLPASGRAESTLSVPAFGRWSIAATSRSGVALRIVDRMSGPGPVAGVAGERDGRLDAFLDRGEVLVVTEGHPKAKGEVDLVVRPFEEQSAPQPPELPPLETVETSLGDFQQRSWWVRVTEPGTFLVEAAGRRLADLRLWRDGRWMVDAEPEPDVVVPLVGRPLAVRRLRAELDAGLFLLTAYGGPGIDWSDDDGRSPLFVRSGIPRLPLAGRSHRTLSPFGVDRFRLPGAATVVRASVAAPPATPIRLELSDFDGEEPFAAGGEFAEITSKSAPPAATIRTDVSGSDRVVVLSGPAGSGYVLEHLESRPEFRFDRPGPHWLATVHAGDPGDSLDATAILAATSGDRRGKIAPVASAAVELDGASGWSRRFNLMGTATLLLRVTSEAAVRYELRSAGDARVRARVEPFAATPAAGLEPPSFRATPLPLHLDAGWWVLTLEPEKKGIAELSLVPPGASPPPPSPLRPAAQFGVVDLDDRRSYRVHLGDQPGVDVGLVLRPIPVDLGDGALPLVVPPCGRLEVPVAVPRAGRLVALDDRGRSLPVSLGAAAATAPPVTAGRFTATVESPDRGTPCTAPPLSASLSLEPPDRPGGALPPLPDRFLAEIPELPLLEPGAPHVLDLDRDMSATFRVRPAKAGLHHLESTGLLATAGTLRTRTMPSFHEAAENGVGRNFRISDYLREGDYLLTVSTAGRTKGHLGVELNRNPLADGGWLTLGAPARATLPPDRGIVYQVKITAPGRFRIRAASGDRLLRCRIEDGRGWPLEPPGAEADLTRELPPGTYRLVLLPEPVSTTVVTSISQSRPPRRVTGHGPHPLPLGRTVDAEWREPAEGAAREPDRWALTMPATAAVEIDLPQEMDGELRRDGDATAAPFARLTAGKGWRGELARGSWTLSVSAARPDDRVRYSVAVRVEPLVAGTEKAIAAPAEVPVVVGHDGLVVLSSRGDEDVRARLLDAAGRTVDLSDDRPDDWNFQIARPLAAGSYRLRVDPVGRASARTTVGMSTPEVRDAAPLAPGRREERPGRRVSVLPLDLPPGATSIALSARAPESVALVLESFDGDAAEVLGTASGREPRIAALVPPPPARLRARLWSLDGRGGAVTVELAASTAPPLSESALSRGPGAGPAAARIERAGLFRLEPPDLPVAAGGGAARSSPTGTVAVPAGLLLLAPAGGTQGRATRLLLGTNTPARVPLGAGEVAVADLAKGDGALIAIARSRNGEPGIAFSKESAARTVGGFASVPGGALAVSLDPTGLSLTGWNAGDREAPIDLDLTLRRVEISRASLLPGGGLDGQLDGSTARAVSLPAGFRQLRIALAAGGAALLASRGGVEQVLWAGDDGPAEFTVASSAATLVLLGTTGESIPFAVRTIPAAAPPALPLDRSFATTGRLRITVPPADVPRTIRLEGADGLATFVGDDGSVARGSVLPIGRSGGRLELAHGTASMLAWIERAGEEAVDRAAAFGLVVGDARPLVLPARQPLGGPATFVVESPAPALLRVRGTAAAATLLTPGGGEPELALHADRIRLDRAIPAGRTTVAFRPLATAPASSEVEFSAAPIEPAAEGLGPEILLGSGETRAFSLTLADERRIGVAVVADSAGAVEVVLSGADGRPRARGASLFETLAAGAWTVLLEARADAPPVRVRLALVGLASLPDRPPDEVLRLYLQAPEAPAAIAAGARSFSATPSPRRQQPAWRSVSSSNDGNDGEFDGGGEGFASDEEDAGDSGTEWPEDAGERPADEEE